MFNFVEFVCERSYKSTEDVSRALREIRDNYSCNTCAALRLAQEIFSRYISVKEIYGEIYCNSISVYMNHDDLVIAFYRDNGNGFFWEDYALRFDSEGRVKVVVL